MVIVASSRVSPLAAVAAGGHADDPVMQVGPALLEEAAEGAVVEMAARVHVAVQRPVGEPDGVAPSVEPVGLLGEAAAHSWIMAENPAAAIRRLLEMAWPQAWPGGKTGTARSDGRCRLPAFGLGRALASALQPGCNWHG